MTQNTHTHEAEAVTRAMAQIGVSLEQAARSVSAAMRQVGDAVRRAWQQMEPTIAQLRAHQRATLGGNGTDARVWPDQWQSAVCSAWLHESCPSGAHGLGCTCHCHRSPR